MIIKLKNLLIEGEQEKSAEDFIKKIIRGTEFENKVYAVGGYVRDLLLGKDAKDLDLVIDYPNGGIVFSNWITKKIGNYKEGSNPVTFPRFLTAQFNLNGVIHNNINLTGYKIEAVAPRSEEYNDLTSRKPDVKRSDLRGDSLRRDLSINSLYKNISTGEIIDPSNLGLSDLKNKILRPAGEPDKVYSEDPLRLMRIVRFYSKFGYKIPLNILKSIKNNSSKLENVSKERISDELNKMLMTTSPSKAIKLLKITGLLKYVMPELIPAIKMTQNQFHNKDVFSHTLDVLSKTRTDLITRLMAIGHDIGKVVTKTVTPTGIYFYGHEIQSEKMIKDILKRLKYPNEIIDSVALGVRNHMRLKHGGDDAVKLTDKSLRKFKIEMGENLERILDLIEADNLSHAPGSEMPNQINIVRKRLDKLDVNVKKPKLPINGEDLKQMNISPGPIYKELLEIVTDKWFENPNLSKQEAIDLIKNYLKNKEYDN